MAPLQPPLRIDIAQSAFEAGQQPFNSVGPSLLPTARGLIVLLDFVETLSWQRRQADF
jgi:hypothetical protein